MAIARQATQQNRHTASASPTIDFAGEGWTPVEDDLVLLFCSTTNTTVVNAVPSGWDDSGAGLVFAGDTTCYIAAVYHWVTAGEESGGTTSYTVSSLWDAAETNMVMGAVYRGVDTTDPIMDTGANSNASNSTTHVLPAIAGTNILDDGVVVGCVNADGAADYTDPAGWTPLEEQTANDPGCWLGQHDTLTTAGVGVSATNITCSISGETAAITIALNPAAGGGTDGTATPAALSVVVAMPQATPAAGTVTSPAATSVAIAMPQAQGRGSQTALPAATSVALTMPQATPLASSTVTPAATSVAVTIPQATPLASSTVTPAASPLTVTIPAVTATGAGGGTANPASITTVVTLPQATPLAGSTATPAATSVAVTMPQATAQASHTATPAVIPITIGVPQATASGATAGTASPNAIAIVTVVPSPTLVYGSIVNPAAIQLAISIGAAIAAGLVPDAHPVTVTLQDEGHTITVRVVGTTATVRTTGTTTTARENR
jgi:hypothetical protein